VDKEVPVKFWKSSGSEVYIRNPDPYPETLNADWILLGGHALSECSAQKIWKDKK